MLKTSLARVMLATTLHHQIASKTSSAFKKLSRSLSLTTSRKEGTRKIDEQNSKLTKKSYEDEKVSTDNELSIKFKAIRQRQIEQMSLEGKVSPYPHKFEPTHSVTAYRNFYNCRVEKGSALIDETVRVAGRVMSTRKAGKKLIFYDIHSDGERVQVMATLKSYQGDFNEAVDCIKRGDIVGIIGYPSKTKLGELSITPCYMQLLTPCLHLIPSTFYGIKDIALRYQRRYLDLIVNDEARIKQLARPKLYRLLRSFFDAQGFREVETPTLNLTSGGATALPFQAHHNEMDIKMYMRVSPELALKKLIVGGMERIYEIGKVFRNEGVSPTHNPEFSICEAYQAYADYNDLMTMTENLFGHLAEEMCCGTQIEYQTPDGRQHTVNFKAPYQRIDILTELKNHIETKLPEPHLMHTREAQNELDEICERCGVTCSEPRTSARLLDKLCDHFIIPNITQPTFLLHHPRVMSPLAKEHRSRPGVTERFELFVPGGMELCNAYTEENDPRRQRENFLEQERSDDPEAQVKDEDFCVALEYGMPPTAGWGVGIDRLLMIFTNSTSIKEVILFPTVKPSLKK